LAVNKHTALPLSLKENISMSEKFEKLLDYQVNEETDKANELFHEIVVEKSRKIYEDLISEEIETEAKKEEAEESVEEAQDEEDEE